MLDFSQMLLVHTETPAWYCSHENCSRTALRTCSFSGFEECQIHALCFCYRQMTRDIRSIARTCHEKRWETTNLGCRHFDKTKPEAFVNGKTPRTFEQEMAWAKVRISSICPYILFEQAQLQWLMLKNCKRLVHAIQEREPATARNASTSLRTFPALLSKHRPCGKLVAVSLG